MSSKEEKSVFKDPLGHEFNSVLGRTCVKGKGHMFSRIQLGIHFEKEPSAWSERILVI